MPEYYEIKVKGHLDQRWSEGFAGLNLTSLNPFTAGSIASGTGSAALPGAVPCADGLIVSHSHVAWMHKK